LTTDFVETPMFVRIIAAAVLPVVVCGCSQKELVARGGAPKTVAAM